MAPPVDPSPGNRGRGALGHLHLLEVERVSGIPPEVTHAVDEHVCSRAETANRQLVSRRNPAFARLEGDADDVSQDVAQRRGALFLDDRLRNEIDGLRDVTQWFA